MPKTTDSIIADVLVREGGVGNDPADTGGPTAFGISQTHNPDAWRNGAPTAEQARAIYEQKYVKGPGFDKVPDKQLQAQLVDFGVNSGPGIAIQKLQAIVHVEQDGVLGPQTLEAMTHMSAEDINNHLVAERIRLIGRIVTKNPTQLKFLNGWLDRSLQFLE